MKNTNRQLRQELSQAGAKASEVSELTFIASKLELLKAGQNKAKSHQGWTKVFSPALLALSTLVIGAVIVMLAQSATPTGWLYPVQKLSDNLVIKFHPDYRASVMMQRAEQVNELVASHAAPSVILATLASYKDELAGYQTMSKTSYAAFDYCKTNLQQAAANAPVNLRPAILKSLESLHST